MVATIDVLLSFYGDSYRVRVCVCKFPKLETKTSALYSERMSRRGLSLEGIKDGEGGKERRRKEELGACSVLHLKERFKGHSRKPRCLNICFL